MALKNPIMVDGMYCGLFDDLKRQQILTVINQKRIDNLKNMIFNFPSEMLDMADDEEISVRNYIKKNNIDYTPYIGELRDYQTVGAGFLYMSPRSILGDGVGLGKTAEISALLNMLKQNNEMNRFLMAVETSAVGQTIQELKRFTGLRIVELPSVKDKMAKAIQKIDWSTVDGIVTRHSTLRSDTFSNWLAINIDSTGKFTLFDTFILDESSLIKNSKTQVYTYTKNICDLVKRVHFLNATVFETNIMDIYYQVDMMDSNILPTKSSIESRFCTWKPKVFWKRQNGSAVQQRAMERTGYKNQAEFKKSLKLFYFGRSIKDTGMERNNEYIVYTVDPTQEQLYAIRKGARYSELLNCPTLVEGCEIEFTREKCPKLDRLLTLCEQDFHDSSVMIYCMYIEAQEKLKEYLEQSGRKVCILNGNTKEEPRKQLIKDFNDGVYDVIITNIKKSLNLYNGDVCIFYTVEGNPAKMEQIRGRIDRNVDNKLKTFVLLLYSHTLEYTLFTKTASTRSKDSKDLTIDFTSAVDYFMDSMRDDDSSE
jgi:hypothetical protein